MMTSADAQAILERAVASMDGREFEAVLGGGVSELTRFANNEITQNVSERRYVLSIRVARGLRTGRATGNDLSPEGIARLRAQADAAAALSPEIPDLLPVPAPQEYRAVSGADSATSALGPEARAREVSRAVARCRAAGVEAAGIYETGFGTIGDYGMLGPLAIANSKGLYAYHQGTDASFRISALDGTASGWAGAESHRASDIDGEALADRAIQKCIGSRSPAVWMPGSYTVVLEPAAVADLIQDMAWISFGASAVQEGRSFLTGRLGSRVLGENITIRDDAYHPLHQGCPFDAEGVPTRPVTIVEAGIAKGPVYDRQTAAKDKLESTGHGLQVPNPVGPLTSNLVLEGGKGSVDDLIKGVERGLLVTRVWYTNVVDPMTVTLTGMTRDGLFAIQDGKLAGAVRNFRFNQSIVRMLTEVEAMSAVQRIEGVVCPGLRVRSFHMSSATEF